jgi:ABC-type uncharacterized transport system substrate-binding protein
MEGCMGGGKIIVALVISVFLATAGISTAKTPSGKFKILVVDSYSRDYTWSQDTNRGFCAAMLKFGYFETSGQAVEYTRNDAVETARVVVKKLWMGAKQKQRRQDLEEEATRIYKIAKDFKPDLIFLGDDEAGEYIGHLYLDTDVPMVFWGFNDNPVKYGLVDTAERPGHNVTGVYQSGYYVESLQLLKTISPKAKTFAILSDGTLSGRTHYKAVQYLARTSGLPLKLVETVATDNFEQWKRKAMDLEKKVDAFYIVQYAGFKDSFGNPVPSSEAAQWYVRNIKVPEATRGHMVKAGFLCAADDSGYKQSYEAVTMAHDILEQKANPATIPTKTPKRGELMANRARAKMLGITLTKRMGIEKYIDGPEQ